MRIINGLILLFFFSCSALAQGLNTAEPVIEIREFNEQKLADYRANSDFQYELVKPEPPNAFERLVARVQDWFWRVLNSGTTGTIIEILWKGGLVFAFVYFIIKIFGVEVSTLFKPSKPNKLDYEVNEEQLDAINFEEEIAKALTQKQWRFAIRLTYLNALKRMADAGLLKVKKGKTNRDYLYELSGSDAENDFERLSFIFDYTWYGHFEADDSIAAQAQEHFANIVDIKGKGK
ncbi:DUF4129 domain-containing protein [Roseivirga misakiensis]|uniref:Protein-glutamine gamma-glutamyltransferase-like C-terminal domain-containing protein n=1 Tax=Roseivirga misakiensis TaxID=1563681 RepID=A0A1E5T3N8_9BACT|nr:DUF4129 domain-containing protein [Roseivirga misakiensis]OEK05951.1 hypothetical protein BFP71_07515 [Roseivirga misakiensis]